VVRLESCRAPDTWLPTRQRARAAPSVGMVQMSPKRSPVTHRFEGESNRAVFSEGFGDGAGGSSSCDRYHAGLMALLAYSMVGV